MKERQEEKEDERKRGSSSSKQAPRLDVTQIFRNRKRVSKVDTTEVRNRDSQKKNLK